MRHQHRHGHRLQQGARHPAQHEFAQAAVPVGSHHDQIGIEIGRSREQLFTHGSVGIWAIGLFHRGMNAARVQRTRHLT